MLCPNCQQEFNSNNNLPRILVFCGHTYCHVCIENSLIKDNLDGKWSLKCFECGVISQVTDGINSFPKNLVLLQVQNQASSQQQNKPAIDNKSKEVTKPQAQSTTNSPKLLCQEHNKKLEAFCEKDLQVLCIDCILSEQHKSHEIISVQKAVEKQKAVMFEEVNTASKVEEKLKFIHSDIKRHIGEMQDQAEKNRRELSQIFNLIREIILEREQALKRQISDNLTKEEIECQNKLTEITDFINQISKLKVEMVNQSQEQELEVLTKAKQRVQLSQDVNGAKSKDLINFSLSLYSQQSLSLVEIKRDQELATISKIIHPSFKGSGQNNSGSNNNGVPQGSTLYSHTASTANKTKKSGPINNQSQQQQINIAQPGLISQNSLNEIKPGKEYMDGASKKQKPNNPQIKSKQSPNRQPTFKKQDSKKQAQGVTILDQNKNGKFKNSQSKVNNPQQIQLHNQNPYGNQNQENQDEVIEDVSSIYPIETNECYFNYSPKNNPNTFQGSNILESKINSNLNDLLDSLNKSDGHNEQVEQRQDNSTASETNGSEGQNKGSQLQKNKSNETPKAKINQWNNKNNQSKIPLKKENSTGDFEEFKNLQIKIQSPFKCAINQSAAYQENCENKGIQRSGSLQRFQTNKCLRQLSDQDQDGLNKYERSNSKVEGQRSIQKNEVYKLQSLSQERKKRKTEKIIQSTEESPLKKEKEDILKGQQDLLKMIKECSQGIDKIEFRPSAKKIQTQESPVKQIATICLVDLTQQAEDQPLRINNFFNKKDSVDDDVVVLKSQPKVLKTRNSSPLNEKMGLKSENIIEDQYEENKSPIHASRSPIKMLTNNQSPQKFFDQISEESIVNNQVQKNSLQFQNQFQVNSNVSVDTSVADPFRALCRMKEEFIFVFSGFNDAKLMSCECFDVQRGVWKEVSQIGKARTKFSAVPISKSRILIFGGKQADGQRTGEIEEYNLKTNKFKMLPFKMPKPRSGFAACVKRDEGKIFFCGGNSGSVLRKFDCLDLKKGKWSRLQEMIQKRDELAVALGPDGKIYAIGGYGGGNSSQNNLNTNISEANQENTKQPQSNCLKTAERFDFSTGQWEMLPEMNEARRALAAVALPDGIYAIGGYDGKQYLSSVEKFDLQKQEWVPVKSMNTSRCTLSAVASSDCQYIYALGGFNGNSLDLVERYNIMSDEWEFTTPMISKRFMHEAVNLVTH